MNRARRLLQVLHRWGGLIAGAYLLLVTLTGATLLFRIDIQRALDPRLFDAGKGPLADPVEVFARLAETYPDSHIAGMDAPTTRRPTTLAYVEKNDRFLTVLIDPVTARVLGELPQRPVIRQLHALHFNLTMGRTGRLVNGIGALVLTGLGVTGLVLWWRGRRHWRQGLSIRRGTRTAIFHRDLHSAVGIWTSLALLMWGVTGAAFVFPTTFTNAIGWFSPVGEAQPPSVQPLAGKDQAPLATQIAAATRQRPDKTVARVLLPGHPSVPLQVMFARQSPARIGESLETLYVDPWSATVLRPGIPRSAGDRFWDAFSTLHTGAFGGLGVRLTWLLFALTPSVLLASGFTTWWLRAFRN